MVGEGIKVFSTKVYEDSVNQEKTFFLDVSQHAMTPWEESYLFGGKSWERNQAHVIQILARDLRPSETTNTYLGGNINECTF